MTTNPFRKANLKNLTRNISVRLTPEQHDQFFRVACEHYRTAADHLRWLVSTHLDEEHRKAQEREYKP